MPFLTITKLLGEGRLFFRRHWQRALHIREKLRFSEEAFHLLLAGAVGVMGGLVNLVFYRATESVKLLFLRSPGDPIEVGRNVGIPPPAVGWKAGAPLGMVA